MNRFSHFTAATVVAIGTTPLTTNGQVPTNPAEDDAIRAVINSTTEAFNRRDPRAWLQVATADAELITARGEVMRGVAEIEKGLTGLFQGRNRQARVKTLDIRLRFIRSDVVLAEVTNECGFRKF